MKQTITKTERKLISFDQRDHGKALNFAQSDLTLLNKLFKTIVANLPELKLDMQVFIAIWENPDEFAFDTLVGKSPLEIAGVPVNKKKAMDLIEMPKSWLNVIKVANQTRSDFENKTVHGNTHEVLLDRLSLSDIEIDNGSLKLTDLYLNELKESFSVFTKNEKQNKALDLLNGVHSNLLELNKLGIYFGDEMTILSQLGFRMGETLRLDPGTAIRELK